MNDPSDPIHSSRASGPRDGDEPGEGSDPTAGSSEWSTWRARVDLGEYDERWARMEAAGENPHGEADLVCRYRPTSVLDAGCGTGRVAIELARRGLDVVGVDLDPDLLGRARAKAPELCWELADLADLDLGRTFDVVMMAGNVVGFVPAADRPTAVGSVAAHVAPGGRLVSGCQLRAGWPTVDEYDAWCSAAGLVLEDRFATWHGTPLGPSPDYSVAVHHRPT
jgi:SAM-dependent methyltransferase